MNSLLQNILAFSTLIIAVAYLVSKFIWKPKKSISKNCKSGDCNCH